MASGYVGVLSAAMADGPTLTAAAAASCMPVTARYTFAPNTLLLGSVLRITAAGRVSAVVTTPGSARFSVLLGPTSNITVFDTGVLTMRTTPAFTTVPWRFDCLLTVRAVGSSTSANIMGVGMMTCEGLIGGVASTSGDSSTLISSVSGGPESAPAVGTGFDSTVANVFDFFWTQTAATGSLTCHQFILESLGLAAA